MASNLLRVAILIVSDTASQDPSTDKCAPVLHQIFNEAQIDWEIVVTQIVSDQIQPIQSFVQRWTDHSDWVNCILTSGGTGFAIKDVTPEAVTPMLHKMAPGLIHGMLSTSLDITPFAMMARPIAGVRNNTLVLTLPGSPKGAKENLEAVIRLLPHACYQAAGMDSRALHSGDVKKLEKEAGISSSKSAHDHNHGHHHHHHHHHGHHGHNVPRPHTKPEDRPISNDVSAGPSGRHRKSPYPMKSVQAALDLIKEFALDTEIESRALDDDISGYVLAEDITAPEAVPAFRASIVDGYAIRIPQGGKFEKGVYPVSQISVATAIEEGKELQELQEGQLARITTGAPLPPGASADIMVEDTVLKSASADGIEEKEVEILTSEVKQGENVREVGSDISKGSTILRKGDLISANGGELGMLLSVGVEKVQVYRKPRVGVMSTGTELVDIHKTPAGKLSHGQVRDTNRLSLLTAIKATGFEAVDLGIVSDYPGILEQTLRNSFRRDIDVIVTTGGVSMGELDLLKPTIERQLGGQIHFGRVSMKPGKPTTFATVQVKNNQGNTVNKLMFGLPGNPASAIVTYHLFVLPALHHASCIKPAGLAKVKVKLDQDVKLDPDRNEYHRVTIVARSDGQLYALSTGGQRSSRIGSFKGANGLLCLPAEKGTIAKGKTLDALLMGNIINDFM